MSTHIQALIHPALTHARRDTKHTHTFFHKELMDIYHSNIIITSKVIEVSSSYFK